MTSRERVRNALTFVEVDRIPIDNEFGGEMQKRFPGDVQKPPYLYPPGRGWGQPCKKGRYMDIWGCIWEAGEDGVCGEVKESPLGNDWSNVRTYQPPWEVLAGADLSKVNSQLFCMPLEELAAKYAGRICFWGEIDRQRILTSGTTQDVRDAVRRVAAAFLKNGRTGVVGQCFGGKDHRMENCETVFEEWSRV